MMFTKLLELCKLFENEKNDSNYQQLLLLLSRAIVDIDKVDIKTNKNGTINEAIYFLYNSLSNHDLFLDHLIQKLLVSVFKKTGSLYFVEHKGTKDFNRIHILVIKELIGWCDGNEFTVMRIFTRLPKLISTWNTLLNAGFSMTDKSYIDFRYYLIKLCTKMLGFNMCFQDVVSNFIFEVFMESVTMMHRFFEAIKPKKCQIDHILFRAVGKMLLLIVQCGKHKQFIQTTKQFYHHMLALLSENHFHIYKIIKTNFCGLIPPPACTRKFVVQINEETGRNFIVFLLKAIVLTKDNQSHIHCSSMVAEIFTNLINVEDSEEPLACIVVESFMDDDEMLILLLSLLLEINSSETSGIVNEHHLFYYLLRSISYDESILIDWLVNDSKKSDPCISFPAYLASYLAHLTTNPKQFLHHTQNVKELFKKTEDSVKACEVDCYQSLTSSQTMNCLVEYGSSDESETSGSSEQQTILSEWSSNILSCLVRFHFKLERLKDKELLPLHLYKILCMLQAVEDLYEV